MDNPYEPPRSNIDETPLLGPVNPWYRVLSWIYVPLGLTGGFVYGSLGLSVGDIGLLVTACSFVLPIVGYAVAVMAQANAYRLWHQLHWLATAALILIVAFLQHVHGNFTSVGLPSVVAINLLSVNSNEHFRRRRIQSAPRGANLQA